ncbi:hypothetical protein CVT24_001468 [Panaeolus cyanescens]|uniref:NACHT domain-containing protein n=1 Tax=Panaeolus cyanescens TaxID=181874 RepID=A0A409VTF8_9AGAR|nr:hypothetical protein CVT24_001468 [Panaeolus cyanescens]
MPVDRTYQTRYPSTPYSSINRQVSTTSLSGPSSFNNSQNDSRVSMHERSPHSVTPGSGRVLTNELEERANGLGNVMRGTRSHVDLNVISPVFDHIPAEQTSNANVDQRLPLSPRVSPAQLHTVTYSSTALNSGQLQSAPTVALGLQPNRNGAHGAPKVLITNSHFTTTNISRETNSSYSALKSLYKKIAPAAFHNSLQHCDRPKCHPGTRESIQRTILGFSNDPSKFSASMLWLYGPAGAGKLRNEEPAEVVAKLPQTIIVDGLDECSNSAAQERVLNVLQLLVSDRNVYPFNIIVVSRPETNIKYWLDNKSITSFKSRINLQDATEKDRDITTFVTDELTTIANSHPFKHHLPPDWPSAELVDEIVGRSSGQFIYASTVVRYVQDCRVVPSTQLEALLSYTLPKNAHPFAELDALYTAIIKKSRYINDFVSLVGVVTDWERFCTSMVDFPRRGLMLLEELPYLQQALSLSAPFDVIISDFSSLFAYSTSMRFNEANDRPYRICTVHSFHKSLLDFVTDPTRAPTGYHLDRGKWQSRLLSTFYAAALCYVQTCLTMYEKGVKFEEGWLFLDHLLLRCTLSAPLVTKVRKILPYIDEAWQEQAAKAYAKLFDDCYGLGARIDLHALPKHPYYGDIGEWPAYYISTEIHRKIQVNREVTLGTFKVAASTQRCELSQRLCEICDRL